MVAMEIDFDVYKALVGKQESEADTFSAVIRRLLGDNGGTSAIAPTNGAVSGATFKGVLFPNGTRFRANYRGKLFTARIIDDEWVSDESGTHGSPSAAAYAITKSGINGWRFWQAQVPGDMNWKTLDSFRS